jgi:hypothetical protein
MGPPKRSRLNVPQYPLLFLVGARQVASGVEQLALAVLDGVRPILEEPNLSRQGLDRLSGSVPAIERPRASRLIPCTVMTLEPPR